MASKNKKFLFDCFFFLMIRRPPRVTQSRASAASDVYKRQARIGGAHIFEVAVGVVAVADGRVAIDHLQRGVEALSLIHISEPTRPS